MVSIHGYRSRKVEAGVYVFALGRIIIERAGSKWKIGSLDGDTGIKHRFDTLREAAEWAIGEL